MTFQIDNGVVYLGTQCPSTILKIESKDSMIDPELRKYATELVNKPFPKQMMLSNGKYSLHLELDEDTYWGLVKLGAEIKTDCETYAEHILIGHIESGLDQQATD
jgi:hypothetical protein